MSIKTIHIKNYKPQKALTKELYNRTLKDDPKFHFFFEPEIIFRITTEDCLTKAKSFLQGKNIEFEEYDYPFPPEGKFGEESGGIVANNLELFLSIFHANSVAALTMNEKDHCKYLERLVHTAFNPKGYSHEQEGKCLVKLAALKLGVNGTGLSREDFIKLVNQFT
jgi:hypothetical protein